MSPEQPLAPETKKSPGERLIRLVDADGRHVRAAETISLGKPEGLWNAYAIVRLNSGEWTLFAREPEESAYAPYAPLLAKTEAEAREEAMTKMSH